MKTVCRVDIVLVSYCATKRSTVCCHTLVLYFHLITNEWETQIPYYVQLTTASPNDLAVGCPVELLVEPSRWAEL